MPPIRNSCVARGGVTAAGNTTVYTVPAATVLLLKDIRVYDTSGTAQTVTLYVNQQGVSAVVIFQQAITAPWFGSWSGWIALNATDTVVVGLTTTANVNYWVSGALLPQIPGF